MGEAHCGGIVLSVWRGREVRKWFFCNLNENEMIFDDDGLEFALTFGGVVIDL